MLMPPVLLPLLTDDDFRHSSPMICPIFNVHCVTNETTAKRDVGALEYVFTHLVAPDSESV
jgi:hypothetical protein